MTEHEVALELGRQLERYLRMTGGIMNDEYEGNHYEGDFIPLETCKENAENFTRSENM